MSDCRKIRESFSEYIDGVLSGPQAEKLEEHLEACPLCAEELEAMREMISVMNGIEAVDPPAGFLSRVNSRLGEAESIPERIRRFARKIFLPLPVKLPIELAGVAAAVLLIAWMSGNLGREGVRQMTPEGTGAPAVFEVDGTDVEREKEEASEILDVDDLVEEVDGDPAAAGASEDVTVALEGSDVSRKAAIGDRSGRSAEPPLPEGEKKGSSTDGVAGTIVRKDKGEETGADEPNPVEEVCKAIALKGGIVRTGSEDTAVPGHGGEAGTGLLKRIETLVDSVGGRIIDSPAGAEEWSETRARQSFAKKVSAVRTSRRSDTEVASATADDTAGRVEEKKERGRLDIGPDHDLPEILYIVIHRSAASRLLEMLESGTVDYSIASKTKEFSPDSLLVRLQFQRRK